MNTAVQVLLVAPVIVFMVWVATRPLTLFDPKLPIEINAMKNMSPEVLATPYGKLVVDLLKTTLAASGEDTLRVRADELAGYSIRLADQIVTQLVEREKEAKALAESTRVVYPVDWAPGPDDEANRSGQHWSQPEIDALVAQFKNGKTGAELAVYHHRTWLAVTSQLAKFGLLNASGSGFKYPDGRAWEL